MTSPGLCAGSPSPQTLPGAQAGTQIEVIYYTDPLCSWSWAFEPQWRRLRFEFGDQLRWRYRMGGMIADWQRFSDPLNDVSRPVQMGPHWYQVRTLSGMPLNERIWYEDPPTSSYPACIATKAAEQQGARAVEVYLRRLREAVMLEGRNIARREVLLAVADETAEAEPGFDGERLQQDLAAETVLDAFREDLKEATYREIGRFPTLILRHPGGRAVVLTGYRPYQALLAVLGKLAPELAPLRRVEEVADYVAHWGRLTTCEVVEAFDGEQEPARAALEAALAQGRLRRLDLPHVRQPIWTTPAQ